MTNLFTRLLRLSRFLGLLFAQLHLTYDAAQWTLLRLEHLSTLALDYLCPILLLTNVYLLSVLLYTDQAIL